MTDSHKGRVAIFFTGLHASADCFIQIEKSSCREGQCPEGDSRSERYLCWMIDTASECEHKFFA